MSLAASAALSLALVSPLVGAQSLAPTSTLAAPTQSSECPIDLLHGVRCVAERAAPAVVSIRVTQQASAASNSQAMPFSLPFDLGPAGPQVSQGSGVLIRADGYIVTNAHVVDNADELIVETSDGNEHAARIVGVDKKSDVAVVKISSKEPASFLKLADSESVRPGDFVVAMGSPFGLDHSISFGVVSAVGRGGMGIVDYEDFIQTDAAINPGNSGGALVNARGELVGINTAILSRSGSSAGIGFAVPSNVVRDIAEQIIEGGKVARGYLGVGIQDLSDDLRAGLGVVASKGALISSVEAHSPAAKAGLTRGDVVLAVDGRRIDSSRQLRLHISRKAPGSSVSLGIEREGKRLDIKVALGNLDVASATAPSKEGQAATENAAPLGIELADASVPSSRGQSSRGFVGGAEIVAVAPGSQASILGLRPGDVIVAIGKTSTPSAKLARKLLAARSKTAPLILTVLRDGHTQYLAIKPHAN